MGTRIAINGFGRIGRMVLRALYESGRTDLEVVAINDLTSPDQLAHSFKYDSVHGRFKGDVVAGADHFTVNETRIACYNERDIQNLPWKALDIDIVMECTGIILSQSTAQSHIDVGAKRVLFSAPAKDDSKTIVYGVNHSTLTAEDIFVSNASCTTNALAPVATVLDDAFGIQTGFMTTVHAYTGDQPTQDSSHRDFYRARAAALSMIPTSTGAAKAIGKVMPNLAGKFDGVAVRVPVPNVSMVDLTVQTERATNTDEIRAAFKDASGGRLKGVLGYIEAPLVSADLNHDPHSSSFVADQTFVQNDNLVRIMSWYDNEWGFSNRMLDTAAEMGKFL